MYLSISLPSKEDYVCLPKNVIKKVFTYYLTTAFLTSKYILIENIIIKAVRLKTAI